MVIEKAKRLVEYGTDVVILLDSITRLARAYNTESPGVGKLLSGGLDANALHKPKRFFGAARNVEEGGSLTILATALVDTGVEDGRGDLRGVQGHRQHGTPPRPPAGGPPRLPGHRREPLAARARKNCSATEDELRLVHILHKVLADMNPVEAMELLLKQLAKHKTNAEFLQSVTLT